jgi:hypothetical protein
MIEQSDKRIVIPFLLVVPDAAPNVALQAPLPKNSDYF